MQMIANFLKPVNILTYVGIAAGGYYLYQKIKKDQPLELGEPVQPGQPAGQLPAGKMSKATAARMADQIWSQMGVWPDWDAIATEFEMLRNSDDIKALAAAFGKRKNSFVSLNGDLFQCLNQCYTNAKASTWGHWNDLKSIKDHCYGYQHLIKWK